MSKRRIAEKKCRAEHRFRATAGDVPRMLRSALAVRC
jgi:hypothetical protein